MVKPGGFVLAAFVSRNAHLRDVASREPERLAKEWEFYEHYLGDGGKYTRGNNAPMIHSTVDEIRRVIDTTKRIARENSIAVELTKLISCEGFLGFRHAETLARLDSDAFAKWLDVVLRNLVQKTKRILELRIISSRSRRGLDRGFLFSLGTSSSHLASRKRKHLHVLLHSLPALTITPFSSIKEPISYILLQKFITTVHGLG